MTRPWTEEEQGELLAICQAASAIIHNMSPASIRLDEAVCEVETLFPHNSKNVPPYINAPRLLGHEVILPDVTVPIATVLGSLHFLQNRKTNMLDFEPDTWHHSLLAFTERAEVDAAKLRAYSSDFQLRFVAQLEGHVLQKPMDIQYDTPAKTLDEDIITLWGPRGYIGSFNPEQQAFIDDLLAWQPLLDSAANEMLELQTRCRALLEKLER